MKSLVTLMAVAASMEVSGSGYYGSYREREQYLPQKRKMNFKKKAKKRMQKASKRRNR